jgi:alpha-D-xyloside xylohydrolase
MLSLPLMARPNSIIAIGKNEHRPDYDFGDGVTLQAYELEDGAGSTVVIPSPAGEVDMTFDVKREGQAITVEQRGALKRWQLLLAGATSIASVEDGVAERTPHGMRITPAHASRRLTIAL